MTESNSQSDKPQASARFSQEQYDFLRQCSEKGEEGIREWNEWRKQNPNEDILLEGANLQRAFLREILLNSSLNSGFSGEVCLKCAKLHGAYMEGADLSDADLRYAKFLGAHLERTDMRYARVQGTDFSRATVDGSTLIWRCEVDHKTKFEGVALDEARIYPATKQLLEYNIRRMNWEEWYKEHPKLKWVVEPFWLMSDYGLSAGRIVAVFLGLAIVFAAIYYIWGLIAPPGIVDYLFVDANGVKVGTGLALVRAVHFSVVIMTVGFTNMHASAHSFWAHVLVGFRMILGFVLLGALVNRFAVLFTAGGPAGKFAQENE